MPLIPGDKAFFSLNVGTTKESIICQIAEYILELYWNNPVTYFHWKILAVAGIWTRYQADVLPIELSWLGSGDKAYELLKFKIEWDESLNDNSNQNL